MTKQDFSRFKVSVSEIDGLFSRPRGINMPSKTDLTKYDKILNLPGERTKEQLKFLRAVDDKIALYNDPPLSKTIISSLIKQYGRIIYNKKTAAIGEAFSFFVKGTELEQEAVSLLSKIDKRNYTLITENTENEYLIGRCDILDEKRGKIIDLKVSWNVNSFLIAKTTPLDKKYWYQMQGYMEIYNVDEAEVVFLLLNTPPELIEREKIKLQNRFMVGEIDREKYELDMDNIESAFTYNNVPLKKRYIRCKVQREPKIFETVYRKVQKAREWMVEFHKEMDKTIFVVPSEKYFDPEKNYTEPDTSEPLQGD